MEVINDDLEYYVQITFLLKNLRLNCLCDSIPYEIMTKIQDILKQNTLESKKTLEDFVKEINTTITKTINFPKDNIIKINENETKLFIETFDLFKTQEIYTLDKLQYDNFCSKIKTDLKKKYIENQNSDIEQYSKLSNYQEAMTAFFLNIDSLNIMPLEVILDIYSNLLEKEFYKILHNELKEKVINNIYDLMTLSLYGNCKNRIKKADARDILSEIKKILKIDDNTSHNTEKNGSILNDFFNMYNSQKTDDDEENLNIREHKNSISKIIWRQYKEIHSLPKSKSKLNNTVHMQKLINKIQENLYAINVTDTISNDQLAETNSDDGEESIIINRANKEENDDNIKLAEEKNIFYIITKDEAEIVVKTAIVKSFINSFNNILIPMLFTNDESKADEIMVDNDKFYLSIIITLIFDYGISAEDIYNDLSKIILVKSNGYQFLIIKLLTGFVININTQSFMLENLNIRNQNTSKLDITKDVLKYIEELKWRDEQENRMSNFIEHRIAEIFFNKKQVTKLISAAWNMVKKNTIKENKVNNTKIKYKTILDAMQENFFHDIDLKREEKNINDKILNGLKLILDIVGKMNITLYSFIQGLELMGTSIYEYFFNILEQGSYVTIESAFKIIEEILFKYTNIVPLKETITQTEYRPYIRVFKCIMGNNKSIFWFNSLKNKNPSEQKWEAIACYFTRLTAEILNNFEKYLKPTVLCLMYNEIYQENKFLYTLINKASEQTDESDIEIPLTKNDIRFCFGWFDSLHDMNYSSETDKEIYTILHRIENIISTKNKMKLKKISLQTKNDKIIDDRHNNIKNETNNSILLNNIIKPEFIQIKDENSNDISKINLDSKYIKPDNVDQNVNVLNKEKNVFQTQNPYEVYIEGEEPFKKLLNFEITCAIPIQYHLFKEIKGQTEKDNEKRRNRINFWEKFLLRIQQLYNLYCYIKHLIGSTNIIDLPTPIKVSKTFELTSLSIKIPSEQLNIFKFVKSDSIKQILNNYNYYKSNTNSLMSFDCSNFNYETEISNPHEKIKFMHYLFEALVFDIYQESFNYINKYFINKSIDLFSILIDLPVIQ